MGQDDLSIRYPRRRVQRAVTSFLARGMVSLLARTEVTGREHFPPGGPLLVVGNHIAAMEVVLMVTYTPWQVEMLGPGDLPPQRAIGVISKLYGYTPIKRGHADRTALTRALDVLRQDGVVGLFPEGGIWDTGPRPARRGVAWLSYRAQAPILPIGFGGLEGALNAIFRLQRPHLAMNVGQVIPAVTLTPGVSRKDCLREAAQKVMDEIMHLVPQQDKEHHPRALDERFELQVSLQTPQGQSVSLPEPGIPHAEALCKMLYRPAIVRIYAKDLNLPVQAFPLGFGNVFGTDDNHRNVLCFFVGLQTLQNTETIEFGHHQVEDDHIGHAFNGLIQAIAPIYRLKDAVFFLLLQ